VLSLHVPAIRVAGLSLSRKAIVSCVVADAAPCVCTSVALVAQNEKRVQGGRVGKRLGGLVVAFLNAEKKEIILWYLSF
jgi:hypothetical protein